MSGDVKEWIAKMDSLRSELIRLRTEPTLASIILSRIQSWRTESTPENFSTIPEKYSATLQYQDEQGWE
jgi:hypothetical protein